MADLEDDQHEELTINGEKITEDVNNTVRQKLGTEKWHPKKVDGWTKDIIDATLKSLAEMKKPFKFVVTCIIMQRNGAGLSSAFTGFWNGDRDGMCSVPYNDNDNLHCITTVYWIKID